ncbi:MAG: sigma-54-dependent Fis family transcriptional regulator [Deltaproteobacteria bacterium]|nr:sigma-54-dependent Fis family transcriptional regulator [Deltaproteobacteria bacterium]
MGCGVLVCDLDARPRAELASALRTHGYVVALAGSIPEALDALGRAEFQALLIALQVPGLEIVGFLREARRLQRALGVVVITDYENVEAALAAMKDGGAADYVTRPLRFCEVEMRLERLLRLREHCDELGRLRTMLDETPGLRGIPADSPAMRVVCERIHLFADSTAPILITGEVGTGKGLVARSIHDVGPRKLAPFLSTTCKRNGSLDVVARLLGAGSEPGMLELAQGGSILLEDIGGLDTRAQAELVELLKTGTFRSGRGEQISVDVRLLATSETDLGSAVEGGRFREDLHGLIRAFEIHLPPLRDRGDDVLLLAHHFLRIIAAKEGRVPKRPSAAAARVLRQHSWPRNVGELRRVIAEAVASSRSTEIQITDLPASVLGGGQRPFTLHLDEQPEVQLGDLVRQFEEDLVKWALEKAEGRPCLAAEILGVPAETVERKRPNTTR